MCVSPFSLYHFVFRVSRNRALTGVVSLPFNPSPPLFANFPKGIRTPQTSPPYLRHEEDTDVSFGLRPLRFSLVFWFSTKISVVIDFQERLLSAK